MSSPFIERMRGRNEVLQQISKQSKESDWTRNLVKDEYGNPDISLCKNCWCMTYTTIENVCAKCKEPKGGKMNPMYLDYDINDLTVRINAWFEEKGLKDPIMQYAKLNEEVGEMAHELTRGNKDTDKMKDAIGDTFVTLVGMAHHLGLDLSECINMAYQTIRNRKGKVVEGSFVKES